MANNANHPDRVYSVTVLLDGEPKPANLPAHFTVLEAIKHVLPGKDKENAAAFTMVDKAVQTNSLDHSLTLEQAGVRDDHLLSITKKDGGGGAP